MHTLDLLIHVPQCNVVARVNGLWITGVPHHWRAHSQGILPHVLSQRQGWLGWCLSFLVLSGPLGERQTERSSTR